MYAAAASKPCRFLHFLRRTDTTAVNESRVKLVKLVHCVRYLEPLTPSLTNPKLPFPNTGPISKSTSTASFLMRTVVSRSSL